MLDAIEQARDRVDFESYIFADALAETFTQALIGAAKRGVTVRIVLDALGVPLGPPRLRERLEAAGAHLVWFNAIGTWTLDKTNYRTHRKLLIVDGRSLLLECRRRGSLARMRAGRAALA